MLLGTRRTFQKVEEQYKALLWATDHRLAIGDRRVWFLNRNWISVICWMPRIRFDFPFVATSESISPKYPNLYHYQYNKYLVLPSLLDFYPFSPFVTEHSAYNYYLPCKIDAPFFFDTVELLYIIKSKLNTLSIYLFLQSIGIRSQC